MLVDPLGTRTDHNSFAAAVHAPLSSFAKAVALTDTTPVTAAVETTLDGTPLATIVTAILDKAHCPTRHTRKQGPRRRSSCIARCQHQLTCLRLSI